MGILSTYIKFLEGNMCTRAFVCIMRQEFVGRSHQSDDVAVHLDFHHTCMLSLAPVSLYRGRLTSVCFLSRRHISIYVRQGAQEAGPRKEEWRR